MMENAGMKGLIEKYIRAYNHFDISGMVALLHESIEFRNMTNGVVDTETKGIEQFRTLAEQSVKVFSQRCQTIRQVTLTGDSAEVDIDYEGVLAIDLPGGMKAGDTLKLQGKSVFRVRDGKLAVIEDYS